MPDKNSNTLSVCMIARNESAILGRCLESIRPVADEIIVVDTGSADSTVEIAEACGAKVVRSEWRQDFAFARNVSLEHASGQWILWLDADDVVPAESAAQIHELKKLRPDRVFAFVVRNEKGGGIGSEFMQARMFPNDRRIRFERRIHEQMMPSALRLGLSLENRPVVIEHHGYGDPEELKKKAARNIALLLEEYDDSGPDAVMAVEIADSYSIVDDRGSAMTWYGRVLDIQGCAKNMPVIASQAHLGLGNVHSRDGRYGRAVEHFEKSLELCPGRPDALYCMAVAQDLDGKADVAIGTLQGIIGSGDKRIVQVSIDFRQTAIKAFIRLARLLGMNNRFDELKHCVERALEQYPGRAEIHNMAGLAYFHRGMYMEALHAYEKSLQIAVTQNLDAYIGLCVIYRMAGREDVMRKTLEQIGPLFCSMPRFHAFCECMNAAQGSVPGEIDREKIAEEKKYLKDIYRL